MLFMVIMGGIAAWLCAAFIFGAGIGRCLKD